MIAALAPRRLLLLLLVAWIVGPVIGELYQRRVCPKAPNWKKAAFCKGVVHKCSADAECESGQRCCPTDKECFLSCQNTVIPDGCPIPIDLALLLDSSGSIGRKNWVKVLNFAKSVVDIYDISEKGTHIAIMMYSDDPEIMIRFNKYTGVELNAVNIKRDISTFKLQKGRTFIDRALVLAGEDLFTEKSGMRKDVRKVALVLTDGIQTKKKGPYTPLQVASSGLQAKGVNVYSLGVGSDIDVLELLDMASSEDFVFSAKNFDDLSTKVREITEAQCQACKETVELVFGIPDSSDIDPRLFNDIKTFFIKIGSLFKVDNRNSHIGVIRYSDTASMAVKLDEFYQTSQLNTFIKNMKPRGTGVNLEQALRKAADQAFTMFGGVRQIYPKTFVVFVPKQTTVSEDVIKQASLKLKSIGVRLLLVMLDSHPQLEFLGTISSQPKSRYILKGFDTAELIKVASYEAVDTICKGRYGKCPIIEAPGPCPEKGAEGSCSIDSDCGAGNKESMCCYSGNCGQGKCTPRVRNCFITMDVAFAIDSSAAVSEEDFENSKKFVKNLLHAFADSENSIHFGIVQYGATAKRVADFNKFISDPSIKDIVTKLSKTNDDTRRVDLALETVKRDVFSLEGGMRQGHPRYVIFLAGGDTDAASADLAKASQPLRDLNVNIIAVGVNSGASRDFLSKLASKPNYVFPAVSSEAVSTNRLAIEKEICHAKPGKCKDIEIPPTCRGVYIPEQYVGCGASAGGQPTGKGADWICPGEQKCCANPTDPCITTCADPPNECRGQYDLTFLLENSDDIGSENFEKMKTFAKDLVNAFIISNFGSHVALVTYGDAAKVEFNFKSIPGATKRMVFNAIDEVRFQSGPGAGVSAGLQKAVDTIYTESGGVRERSNKSLVILGSGKFQDAKKAALLASQLKQSQVDVFAVPVGGQGDIAAIRNVVSKKIENNAFITTSFDALKPHLRALTKAVCDGAQKLRPCNLPQDVYFAIPTATSLGGDLNKIKNVFNNLLKFFIVSNRVAHFGIIQYSNNAAVTRRLDQIYTRKGLVQYINSIQPSGNGFNVEAAFKRAKDHGFTIFGGVRQTVPKTLVIVVPRQPSSSLDNILAAANNLKMMGVKVVLLGLSEAGNLVDYSNVASKPSVKFLFGDTIGDLDGNVYNIKETICRGRYGKCPPTQPESCRNVALTCSLDADCGAPTTMCCLTPGCQRSCVPKIDNCFVNMEVTIAIDTSQGVAGGELDAVKNFASSIIRPLAASENSIRISLMTYGETAQTLARFRDRKPERELLGLLSGIKASAEVGRDLNVAFSSIRKDHFSLEGGMRQGHPRLVVFITGGLPMAEFTQSAQTVKELDGMRVMAIGTNQAVPDGLLQGISTNNLFFKANSPADLSSIRDQTVRAFCRPKPGKCPPAAAPIGRCGDVVPPKYIPCGTSAGQTQNSDWPCPGEQKCCKDPESGCHSVCLEPPRECKGKHDLAILIEGNDEVGETGFNKVKTFVKQLINGFNIRQGQTHVSVVSYGEKPKLDFKFNTIRSPTKEKLNLAIDRIQFPGGGPSSTSRALQTVYGEVYKVDSGARERGVNKSLLIISRGKFTNPKNAARYASLLIQNNVDVYFMAIGGNEDIPSIRKVASRLHHKTGFMTSTYDALKPDLRAVTNRICEGAEKPKVCDLPLDIIYGIPVGTQITRGGLREIQTMLRSLTRRFMISNRAVHIGMLPYSDSAALEKPIDAMYSPSEIDGYLGELELRGTGYDVAKAMNVAADHGFTVYGGTRPTAPKTFVLVVPGDIPPEQEQAVEDAAKKIKSMGIKLMMLVLGGEKTNTQSLRRFVTQPARKYLTVGNYDEMISSTESNSRTICRGRYPKCPIIVPPAECPVDDESDCELDADCAPGSACCGTGCPGVTSCIKGIENCFVNMDIALAVDTTVSAADLPAVKAFTKDLVASIADSENSIHFSLLTYADTAKTLTNFREYVSQEGLSKFIDGISASPSKDARVDLAVGGIEKDLFSLEGGMRQGHPRYAIFISSGGNSAASGKLSEASKGLKKLKVNMVSVATSGGVDDAFADDLAAPTNLKFKAPSAAELPGIVQNIRRELCKEKQGNCPPAQATCLSPGGEVPLNYIPCGDSAKKPGRTAKENDWDCPGEQKCCLDPTGCFSVCRDPPNDCKGKYDLTLLLDSSDAVGEEGFKKVKTFAKDIVDAFDVSESGTKVAVISYGATPKVDLTFQHKPSNKERIKSIIDGIPYKGDGPSSTNDALQKALDVVYSTSTGARDGVNKSLVIVSPGKFQNQAGSIRLAGLLKLEQVDVFAVPVGKNPDIGTLRKLVSDQQNNNVFMTTSPSALRPHVRALTDTICLGADKIKVCDRKMDVVFGIPTATELGLDFQKVKDFYKNMLTLFKISNRNVHVGIVPYSNSATQTVNLDHMYDREQLTDYVDNMKLSGEGYNVQEALRVAADHAFTMFGGVRPTAPKTFVLFIPGKAAVNNEAIAAAAAKLKSVGARLMVVGLENMVDPAFFKQVSTQPAAKHFLYGNYDKIGAGVYDAVETICQAKYGKCPAFPPPPPADCSGLEDECSVDGDCPGDEGVCCRSGTPSCGFMECTNRVKNCYVAMDVALAVDATADIPDNEFNSVQQFITRIINANADSENNNHFGILKYGQTATKLTNFRQFDSEAKLREILRGLSKTADTERRVDNALRGMKTHMFSLEGGMRQGRPRFALIVVSGPASASTGDLLEASKELRALDIKIIAVGSNKNVDNGFLGQVATDPSLVFKANTPEDLSSLWNTIQGVMCSQKPGNCPTNVAPTCGAPGSPVPRQSIPCGDSAGKAGRSAKENDWDCPGLTRCCLDPTGCHSVCLPPPNVCNGQFDLTIVMDASVNTGKSGFDSVKIFAKQLVDAFDVEGAGTRVSVISYSDKPRINFGFADVNRKDAIKNAIDGVAYQGGGISATSDALQLAVDKVYKIENGMRSSSNKSLVIIGPGKFANPDQAARIANELRQNLVDVFVMPVGYDPDVLSIKRVASNPVDKNVFMTTTPEALRPHLRSLTKRICDGAERPKVCDKPIDVVYGIPNAASLGPDFANVKYFFKSMSKQFFVSNRNTHIGIIPYSDSAALTVDLDSVYNREGIINAIDKLKPSGTQFNVAKAIQVAADNAFTIFGGTRPTAPKTFVLYVPSSRPEDAAAIKAASDKLKSVGVRLMVVGSEENVDFYRGVSSQPPKKHYLHGSYDKNAAGVFDAVDTICKARYGTCPVGAQVKVDPGAEGCPSQDACSADGDCKDPNHLCCEGCAKTCVPAVRNCFVTMDVAIAMEVTTRIPDGDFDDQKNIVTRIINSFAGSENSIHFGLLKYASTAQTVADFNRIVPYNQLTDTVKKMQKSSETERRIDIALQTISQGIFSLEGGMRQGHPRNVIFITSGSTSANSEDLGKAAKDLRALGVNIIAVGLKNADPSFLKTLASEERFAFKASTPEEVEGLWNKIQAQLCEKKPGKCRPVERTCGAPGSPVPPQFIPCGDSAGKAGRSAKENDWDCPGQSRCCLDPTGCNSICQPVPNVCLNRAHDLAILIENSDAVGPHGFNKAKEFAQSLADAFYISPTNTHVAIATYGPKADVHYRFNWFQGPQNSNANVRRSIGRIQFVGGQTAPASNALQAALDDIFTERSGAREGVNKSLVLVGSGRFVDAARAVGLSAALKQNLVDVFSVPVGPNPDIANIRKFASPVVEKNVFLSSSYDALRPHVRAVTKAICDGAIKIQKCKQPIDVYFAIPTSTSIFGISDSIRKSFVGLLRQLEVSNRGLHVGLIKYSDNAEVVTHLDWVYNRDWLENIINRIPVEGSSLNIAKALRVAADQGFTIYGGTRQTAPKVLVLFVPGPVTDTNEIQAAANKLKSLGVRIVVLGLQNAVDPRIYNTVVTQPPSKFLLTSDSFAGLSLGLNAASNRICNAKYGKCPKQPPKPAECPDDDVNECSQDKDCKGKGDLCCKGGCNKRVCITGIKNCFIPMEIAFAVDVSETMTTAALESSKDFVKEVIRTYASSENDIHFGLMTFAGTPKALTPGFRKFKTEQELQGIVNQIKSVNDPSRRLDLALKEAKRSIFSLEGRIRHGHPRYLIILTSSGTSEGSGDLAEAKKELDKLKVRTVAIGTNNGVDGVFLQQLASENSYVFQAQGASQLESIRPQVQSSFCAEKPGNCPVPSVTPDPAVCGSQTVVPLQFIPCGDSAGKARRSQRENDWDCPGEAKCCKDPNTGCHNVCVHPPIICNKIKDIELVVESSDLIGKRGFEKLKKFLQYFSEAFGVSRDGSHIGMIVYSSRSREAFRLTAYRDTANLKTGIAKARFGGGSYPSPSEGLVTALDISLTQRGGARESVNKSLVLFTSGRFERPAKAIAVASQLKEGLVDVYAVAIGDNPDLETLKQVVSRPIEPNIFMMSSADALRAQARALVKRVCDGAEKNYIVSISQEVSMETSHMSHVHQPRANMLTFRHWFNS